MKVIKNQALALLAACLSVTVAPAKAAIIISEVAPYASGNVGSTYAADWFELTNTGSSAVNISGWMVDDNSNSFGAAVALRGVSSIAAGQSVIFIESNASGSTDASINAGFKSAWFGTSAPTGLVIGNYGGSGVSLSTTADALNIFDSLGSLITRVDFGVSTAGRTFDNSSGQNNVVLTQLSSAGVNGAFTSFNGKEIGSPGVIAAVPEPESYALALLALGVIGLVAKRKR